MRVISLKAATTCKKPDNSLSFVTVLDAQNILDILIQDHKIPATCHYNVLLFNLFEEDFQTQTIFKLTVF